MGEILGKKGDIILRAKHKDLKDRWSVVNSVRLEESQKFKWIRELYKEFKRTNLNLGFDSMQNKNVLIKSVKYNKEKSNEKQREVLEVQKRILSDIKSTRLPRLLDSFYAEESYELLRIKKDEPVLILEYKEGKTLADIIKNKELSEERNNCVEGLEMVNLSKIVKIIREVIKFSLELENKGYIHLGITPNNIIIDNDGEVGFLGVGRICSIKNEALDSEHINFSRTFFGYSAPELNDEGLIWGKYSKPREIIAFSVGVLLYQLVCEDLSFPREAVCNGSLYYPNSVAIEKIKYQKNGYRLSNLIEQLCNHNVKERLIDYGKIEEELEKLNKNPEDLSNLKSFFVSSETEVLYKGLEGHIKSFNFERYHGFILSDGKNFYLRKKEIIESNIKNICEGLEIKFDVAKDSSGEIFACNIRSKEASAIDIYENEYEDYYEYSDEESRGVTFKNLLNKVKAFIDK